MSVIVVVGAGYVGLTAAIGYANQGNTVFLSEINAEKAEVLRSGKTPFFEPNLQEAYDAVFKKSLFLVEDLSSFCEKTKVDFIFSCVPTPQKKDGSCDLKFVKDLWKSLLSFKFDQPVVLINKSTVIPGTCDSFYSRLKKNNVTLVNSPEFLRQGSAYSDFLRPDRIVWGLFDEDLKNENLKESLKKLSKNFVVPEKIIFSDFKTSELAKYACNGMLSSRLTFMNQIFRLSLELGANMKLIEKIVGLDHRIGPNYLAAGVGFGGSCLPKDLKALIKLCDKLGVNADFLQGVYDFNDAQASWYFKKWERLVGGFSGKEIIFPRLSFKKGTGDLRNSVLFKLFCKSLKSKAKSVLVLEKSFTAAEKILIEGLIKKRKISKKNDSGGQVIFDDEIGL